MSPAAGASTGGPVLTWRPAGPDDGELLDRLWAAAFPELGGSPPAPRALLADAPPPGAAVGLDAAGAPRAAVLVAAVPDEPGARRLHVLADATGGRAWPAAHAEAVARLRAAGVARWYVSVREDCAGALRRLREHGYEVVGRSWGASLDLVALDRPRLAALVERAEAGGARVERLSPADAVAAHALLETHRGDFPRTPVTVPSQRSVAEVAALLERGEAWGARGPVDGAGEELLALTVAVRDGDAAEVEFTVTDRRARRRGLAAAVKAACVLALADAGVRRAGTGGAQANDASLAANRRLGFTVGPLWLSLVGSTAP